MLARLVLVARWAQHHGHSQTKVGAKGVHSYGATTIADLWRGEEDDGVLCKVDLDWIDSENICIFLISYFQFHAIPKNSFGSLSLTLSIFKAKYSLAANSAISTMAMQSS